LIYFQLANSEKYKFADEASGYLRLDKQGSEYFDRLDNSESDSFNITSKSKFLDIMKKELADSIIPLNIDKISIVGTQIDKNSEGKNIIILVKISPPGDDEIRNVDRIIEDLNEMVRNKEISPLMYNKNETIFLDGDYGFTRTSKL